MCPWCLTVIPCNHHQTPRIIDQCLPWPVLDHHEPSLTARKTIIKHQQATPYQQPSMAFPRQLFRCSPSSTMTVSLGIFFGGWLKVITEKWMLFHVEMLMFAMFAVFLVAHISPWQPRVTSEPPISSCCTSSFSSWGYDPWPSWSITRSTLDRDQPLTNMNTCLAAMFQRSPGCQKPLCVCVGALANVNHHHPRSIILVDHLSWWSRVFTYIHAYIGNC